MFKIILIAVLLATSASVNAASNDEAQIWNLEKAYWEFVKANDLEKYRALWHNDFLGWPSFSPEPLGKDHITDWITSNTSQGLQFESSPIEQTGIQVTGDVALSYYRITINWSNNAGSEKTTSKIRITHTWLRTRDTWVILGGMSSPVNEHGQ